MAPSPNALLHLATLGPVGRLPAPGTWGSLVAVIAAPLFFLPLPLWGKLLVLICLIPLGTLACNRAQSYYRREDPSPAIIDEFTGQLLVFLPLREPNILLLVGGFFLFRFFDILKPWPIKASESWFSGGFEVMLDDLLAGALALLLLWAFVFLF